MTTNTLFQGIRAIETQRGYSNDTKQVIARGRELAEQAKQTIKGQLQFPFKEMREMVTMDAESKIKGFNITPSSNIIPRCKYLEGVTSNILYPKINGNMAVWNGGNAEQTTITSKELKPHRAYAVLLYSKMLALSTDQALQSALTEDMINCIYERVEKTMFSDFSGDTENQTPKGLFYDRTPIDVSGLTLEEIAEIEKTFFDAKGTKPTYIFSTDVYQTLKENHSNLFTNGNLFNNIEFIVTPNMQDNCFILTDLSKIIVTQHGSIDVLVDTFTRAGDGLIRLVCDSYWDFDVLDDDMFVYAKLVE